MSARTTTEGNGAGVETVEAAVDAVAQPGTSAAAEEKRNGGARLALIVGVAALAALAGWVVVSGRRARRTVLGVKLPRGSRTPGDVLADAVEEAGRAGRRATDLAAVKEMREKVGR
jgi:hypothetical protein